MVVLILLNLSGSQVEEVVVVSICGIDRASSRIRSEVPGPSPLERPIESAGMCPLEAVATKTKSPQR